jgi:hypothetical protein
MQNFKTAVRRQLLEDLQPLGITAAINEQTLIIWNQIFRNTKSSPIQHHKNDCSLTFIFPEPRNPYWNMPMDT